MMGTEAAVDRIRAWGEARDWRGYDPYDALSSPLAPLLTLGTDIGRRVLTQAVKSAPVNLRPALGIRPVWNAKAVALVASAYARLSVARDDDVARRRAIVLLEQLIDGSTATIGLGWGYPFDVQTRFFGYRRGTPNAITTSFAAHALLDAHELIGTSAAWLDGALRPIDSPKSRRSVPGDAFAGSVGPIVSRHFWIAFGASSARSTHGPDDMNVVSSPKNGRSRCTA